MKSNELGYLAILYSAVVVARVSHASRLVFMRTLVCAISGEFSCDRLNRRFSCEKIFEKYVGHNRKCYGHYYGHYHAGNSVMSNTFTLN